MTLPLTDSLQRSYRGHIMLYNATNVYLHSMKQTRKKCLLYNYVFHSKLRFTSKTWSPESIAPSRFRTTHLPRSKNAWKPINTLQRLYKAHGMLQTWPWLKQAPKKQQTKRKLWYTEVRVEQEVSGIVCSKTPRTCQANTCGIVSCSQVSLFQKQAAENHASNADVNKTHTFTGNNGK